MSPATVILDVVAGPHEGEKREFDEHGTLLAGRSAAAQLRLPRDPHFSRNHFRVEVKPPHCHLVDLDSSNGTFVNGKRVTDAWLRDGDTISGGLTRILVRIQDDAAATQAFACAGDGTGPPGRLEMPRKIVHYDIVREIGRGAMGVVYHGRAADTRQDVAIKLISPTVQLDDKAMQTFIREGSILRQLDHKRIIRFVEMGVFNGHLFLAMEHVQPIDLDKTLDRLKTRDRIRVCCGLARQILDGLAYAHKRDLVHRDVKPKNVLVSKRPGGLSAKLADFGLAKNFMDAGLSQISGEHEIKGTLCFMAPEQVVNCRFARPQADLFSAGATLYTWLSGRHIYNLDDYKTAWAAVLNSGPIPIQQQMELPEGLAHVVNRALARDVEERYQSATEMRKDLEPWAR